MIVTLKASQIQLFKNFLSSLQHAEFALVDLKKATGMSVTADDIVVKCRLDLTVPFDDEGEFVLKVDTFLKIMNCAEHEVVISASSSTLKVTVDGTDLLIQSPYMEFEPFPVPDIHSVAYAITSDRIQEIVTNLAVQKMAKSMPIAVMEFGDRTKYGVNTHMASYKTPEFACLNDLCVSYDFYKYLAALPKFKIPDWRFFKDTNWFGFSCGYATYFTAIAKDHTFPNLDDVSQQAKRAVLTLASMDETNSISKVLTKLFIPVFDDPEPLLYLSLQPNRLRFNVIDKANNVSSAEGIFTVATMTPGQDVVAKVHFVGFSSVIDKKSLSYPVKVSALTTALLFEYGDVQDYVILYS